MNTDRWPDVRRLLEALLDLPPDRREAFLDRACLDDDALRDELERVLALEDESVDFMEPPALGHLAAGGCGPDGPEAALATAMEQLGTERAGGHARTEPLGELVTACVDLGLIAQSRGDAHALAGDVRLARARWRDALGWYVRGREAGAELRAGGAPETDVVLRDLDRRERACRKRLGPTTS